MSAKSKLKKGLAITGTALVGLGVAAWYVLRIPPRVVNWVLKNKVKTIAILAAGYFGYGKLQQKFHFGADRKDPRVEFMETMKKHQAIADRIASQNGYPQKDIPNFETDTMTASNTTTQAAPKEPVTPNPIQAATGQVLTPMPEPAPLPPERPAEDVKLDQEAEAAIINNAFISSPTADLVNSTGTRALPVGERLQYAVEKAARGTRDPDRSGVNTILICSADNPKNFVALHVGFHLHPKKSIKNIRKYRAYEGLVTPQEGFVPMVGQFNINFPEAPGVRFGIDVDQNGARLIDYQDGAPTLDVQKDRGKTLLLVNSDGVAARILDQNIVEDTFRKVDLNQSRTFDSIDFTCYMDPGWNRPAKSAQPTVPPQTITQSR